MHPKALSVIPLVFLVFQVSGILCADPSHLVTKLPGQPKVAFKQYAGQVTITEGKGLFYWFYEADQANASSLPLVLWLNGGPGCSSVGAGALGELGPFQPGETKLNLNAYAWNKAANMIFLEAPAGVGYSYSNTKENYTDNNTATDNLAFLVQWFQIFPEYQKNEFYITGESYAGHYIPTLALKILAYNKQGGSINFKGFAIGNAWTAEVYDNVGNLQFLYTHSLISEEVYNEAMSNCYSANGDFKKCGQANNLIDIMTENIDVYNVYTKVCPNSMSTKFHNKLPSTRQLPGIPRVYQTKDTSCVDFITPYLNRVDVQAALHIENKAANWSECNDDIFNGYSVEDVALSMLPVYKNLFAAGIRIWIYSGDFDNAVSTLSTKLWLKALNLTVETPWYAWNSQDQVGGWTQKYTGLNFVTIRGAGHMVPYDQPVAALTLFEAFLQGNPLKSF